jgi:hypothetical protein
MPLRSFVPITAAGQRRIYTGFPFNKAQELCTYTLQVYKRLPSGLKRAGAYRDAGTFAVKREATFWVLA